MFPCILIFWFKSVFTGEGQERSLFVFHTFFPGKTKGNEKETKKVCFTGKKRRLSAAYGFAKID